MKSLHPLAPLLVLIMMAAVRFWGLPHINLGALKVLVNPLEVSAYAIAVYAYARQPGSLMFAYIAAPVASLLVWQTFNTVTALVHLIH